MKRGQETGCKNLIINFNKPISGHQYHRLRSDLTELSACVPVILVSTINQNSVEHGCLLRT